MKNSQTERIEVNANPSIAKLLFNMQIGERIRNLREGQGITQEELSRKINISQAMLSMIECGTKPVSLIQSKKIADVLGCALDDLADVGFKGGAAHE